VIVTREFAAITRAQFLPMPTPWVCCSTGRMTTSEETAERLEHVVARLDREFPMHPHAFIEEIVDAASRRLLENAHFDQYVPLLAHRAAREELSTAVV